MLGRHTTDWLTRAVLNAAANLTPATAMLESLPVTSPPFGTEVKDLSTPTLDL